MTGNGSRYCTLLTLLLATTHALYRPDAENCVSKRKESRRACVVPAACKSQTKLQCSRAHTHTHTHTRTLSRCLRTNVACCTACCTNFHRILAVRNTPTDGMCRRRFCVGKSDGATWTKRGDHVKLSHVAAWPVFVCRAPQFLHVYVSMLCMSFAQSRLELLAAPSGDETPLVRNAL